MTEGEQLNRQNVDGAAAEKGSASPEIQVEDDAGRDPRQHVLETGSKPEEEEEDGSIDPENEVTGIRLIVLHTGLCLCTLLVGLDFNLIATAVPVITSHFHSIGDVGWYGSAFYIALCSTQPLAGKAYILFPKKAVYLISIVIFEIGSLICALAPTSKALIGGRAITGLGASGIFAGGLVIVTTIIPLHKRAVWQGIINSTFAVASVIGPVIGGALTQHVTWRWCFYINLPIAGFSATVVFFFLTLRPAKTEQIALVKKIQGLDGVGFVLFAGAVAMLLLALQFSGTYTWKSSVIIGLLVGSAITMLLFIVWAFYFQDNALIPPSIFSYRNVILIFISALFANGPFQVMVYWLPIWFQAVLGVSPTVSGVRYLPTVIADVLTSVIGSGIVMKLGTWNPFLLFGTASMSIGCGLLTTLAPSVSDGHWIGFQILCGVGYSLVISMAHLGVQATLPKELVPIGATTLLFGMSTSCAVFLAVGQAVFQSRLSSELLQVLPTSVVNEIISVGATQIRTVTSMQNFAAVIHAYSEAVTQVFYIPTAGPIISFFCICGTQWISIKRADLKKEYKKS